MHRGGPTPERGLSGHESAAILHAGAGPRTDTAKYSAGGDRPVSHPVLYNEFFPDASLERMSSPQTRRRDIEDAALRVFARKGYRRAVVADVAAEAGVSKGTIYTYFSRKEHLLGAVFDRITHEAAVRRKRIVNSDRPPLEKIRALLHVVTDVFASDETLATAMIDLWVAGLRYPDRFGIDFRSFYGETRSVFRDLLREVEKQDDTGVPGSTAAVLVGAADGLFLQWLFDPDNVDVSTGLDDLAALLDLRRRPPDAPSSPA